MNGTATSLNQSITASWGVAQKKRAKRTIGLNNTNGTTGSDPPIPGPSTETPADRPPTPTPIKRRRTRHDPEQLAAKYAPPDLKLGLLGGLREQITQLMEIVVLPLLHPEIYQHTGVPRPRGVLLHGVPGGGKTQLVRCLAGVRTGHQGRTDGSGIGAAVHLGVCAIDSLGYVWRIGKDAEGYV